MEFIAHRGLWKREEEKNTLLSLFEALEKGFGIETDIRDCNGELVISHDMAIIGSSPPLLSLFEFYRSKKLESTLALNIKSDGLQKNLKELIIRHQIKNYFVFDMSVPDTLGYIKGGIKTFSRRSEFERMSGVDAACHGTWVDELQEEWINESQLFELTANNNQICIASPELHSRDEKKQWVCLKDSIKKGLKSQQIMLCTDYPEKAKAFFEND